jgi:hypothetical protein
LCWWRWRDSSGILGKGRGRRKRRCWWCRGGLIGLRLRTGKNKRVSINKNQSLRKNMWEKVYHHQIILLWDRIVFIGTDFFYCTYFEFCLLTVCIGMEK